MRHHGEGEEEEQDSGRPPGQDVRGAEEAVPRPQGGPGARERQAEGGIAGHLPQGKAPSL